MSSERSLNRFISIDIDGVTWSGLYTDCKVVKSNKSDQPDFAEFTIFNLNSANRNFVSQKRENDTPKICRIVAGYEGQELQIFLGEVQKVTHKKDTSNWVTTITCGDSSSYLGQSYINKTYESEVTIKQLIDDITLSGGLSSEPVEYIEVPDRALNKRGVTVSGTCKNEIDRICKNEQLDWCIQDGVVTVCKKGKARVTTLFSINATNGMVGTPVWKDVKGVKGQKIAEPLRMDVTCLCIPSIKPNDRVKVTSGEMVSIVNGQVFGNENEPLVVDLAVESVSHDISNYSGNFYTTITGKVLEGQDYE